MPLENTKKTKWTIHLGKTSQVMELQYQEIEGIIQSISIKINNKTEAAIQMKPVEFQKMYLILRSFHDILVSNDTINLENPTFHSILPQYKVENDEDSPENRKINTDEWDPW